MDNRTNELERRSRSHPPRVTVQNTDDPAEIRDQIAQTRTEMEQTIDQIQDRLSPEHIRQQTQEAIREATIGKVEDMTHRAEREVSSWGRKFARTVRENPVPMALIGLGIGWLAISENNGETYPYTTEEYYPYDAAGQYRGTRYEQRRAADDEWRRGDYPRDEWGRRDDRRSDAGHAAEKVQERAAHMAESVQERADEALTLAERRARAFREQVGETAEHTQQRVEETAEQLEARARRTVRRTKRTFWETMNENPLAVGATAVAVGALVGMALPASEPENRWMGESRDHLVEEAKEAVQETVQKAQTVAQEAKDAAVETAKREAEKQNLPFGEKESAGRSETEQTSRTASQTTSGSTPSSRTTPGSTPGSTPSSRTTSGSTSTPQTTRDNRPRS
ncbi:MAG: DUF3618 domain-containing protein [Anaerolineales bacterium]|nr:DUF3618 domain-containing protein [Anaerolineales bacterium]